MVWNIHVEGIVQGVGFRPFVYRLAHELGVAGWVLNASDGVHIRAKGKSEQLQLFVKRLKANKPPAALVTSVSYQATDKTVEGGFVIIESDEVSGHTLVSPDLATCPDCLSELLDPSNRRYHYPFTNCTNCGPRFTIIEDLPYDRVNTTMAPFKLCEECRQEYLDPTNRRFHAQPNACFVCGPTLEFIVAATDERLQGSTQEQSDALMRRATQLLLEGGILAVKGLGGYHLVCDASNEQAVALLRRRKQRLRKPLAVMLKDIQTVKDYFDVVCPEEQLLQSMASPIVLLQRSADREDDLQLAPSVAFGLDEIGVMLPATPLQHLLLALADRPLVMTSGNISEEPIIGDDDDALKLLLGIADAFVRNNRPIQSRYDDSVVRVLKDSCTSTQYVRRARGYAPLPLALPFALQEERALLAVGPEQKNTFCLASNGEALLSQHLGDLANAHAFDNQLQTVELYERLFRIKPTALACDMHPEYLTTRWAEEQSASSGLPLVKVQHHHAHIAAVLGENLVANATSKGAGSAVLQTSQDEVIGIALDGTGYGLDGTIWGGEVLIASLSQFRRFAHLEPFRLPGGAGAIRHPLRAAYALLLQHNLTKHPAAAKVKERLGEERVSVIEQMVALGLNSPFTSSAGRLFDAVSALLGVCDEASYEGEPAVLLEAALSGEQCTSTPLPQKRALTVSSAGPHVILTSELIRALLDGMQAGSSVCALSRFFHEELVSSLVGAALFAREQAGLATVALSGGVFNNRFIATQLPSMLEKEGFTVLCHKALPPNDGCISYGQAIVASSSMITSP